jgi:hypothetical protein
VRVPVVELDTQRQRIIVPEDATTHGGRIAPGEAEVLERHRVGAGEEAGENGSKEEQAEHE